MALKETPRLVGTRLGSPNDYGIRWGQGEGCGAAGGGFWGTPRVPTP